MTIVPHDAMSRFFEAARSPCTAQDIRRALKIIERISVEKEIDIRSALPSTCYWGEFTRAIQVSSVGCESPMADALCRRALALAIDPVVGRSHSDDIPHSLFKAAAHAPLPIGPFLPGELTKSIHISAAQ